ncbi:MAG: hypothetical protein ACYC6F_17990 [Longimicrobiales bacterium]
MSSKRRAGVAMAVLLAASAPGAHAQAAGDTLTEPYFGAVAEYFVLPRSEVTILGDWNLPAEEIPVVLFLARRGGVSPEAVVALRRSGQGWAALAERYRMGPAEFHVPLPESAAAGSLEGVYRTFRSLPTSGWQEIELTDADIVGLVNLRLLSETLRRPPQDILAEQAGVSWVAVYARLLGGAGLVR